MIPLPPWLESVRKWVVLGLVVLHLLAITLLALPSPGGGLNRRDWQNPTVQAEFDAWNTRLAALGWTGTSDELQDEVFAFAKGYAELHSSLKEPFNPYYRCCGTYQSWRMFVAPHRYPSRLQIRVHEQGRWRAVYAARDPELDWLASTFDNDRMRSALFRYGWGNKYPHQYKALCEWIAEQARRDFPDADKVQIRFASYQTLSPEQARAGVDPEVTWKRTRVLPLREDMR